MNNEAIQRILSYNYKCPKCFGSGRFKASDCEYCKGIGRVVKHDFIMGVK